MNWVEVLKDLVSFLENHESDIAMGIDDFEKLRDVYKLVIGRDPCN